MRHSKTQNANRICLVLVVILLMLFTANGFGASSNSNQTSASTIRVAILPFYTDNKKMQQLANDSHTLISAQLSDNKNISPLSKYLVNDLISQQSLSAWYPEIPGTLKRKTWHSFAWSSGAQVVIRGQISTPILYQKGSTQVTQSSDPILVLTAQSTETGNVITLSVVASKANWANRVKELGDQLAVELLLSARAMTIAQLVKTEYLNIVKLRISKNISRAQLIIRVTSNHKDIKEGLSSKQHSLILKRLTTGLTSFNFKIANRQSKASVLAIVSIKKGTLKIENNKKIQRTVVTLKLIKTNNPLSNIVLTQNIYHTSAVTDGIRLLASKAAVALIIPERKCSKFIYHSHKLKIHPISPAIN